MTELTIMNDIKAEIFVNIYVFPLGQRVLVIFVNQLIAAQLIKMLN